MPKRLVKIERTITLADRLQEDINHRQLSEGDIYFTTVEAAAFLGVSGASANRALQLLEKRGTIIRGQKKGAIVLDPSVRKAALEHIHFLFDGRLESLDHFGEEVIQGVRDEMPLSHVDYTMLYYRTEQEDVRNMIQQAKASGQTHGYVMVSSSPEIQRLLSMSEFPSVVFGSRCPGVPQVSNLDIDHEEGFRLLMNYLHERRCRKIGLVMRRVVLPGDVETINAALRVGIPYCYFLQHKEDDPELITEMMELIDKKFDADGYICLTTAYADAIREALSRSGRDPRKTEIVVQFYYRREEHPPYTHVVPQLNARGMGRRLGRLLNDSVIGMQPKRETTPVCMVTRFDQSQPWEQEEFDPFPSRFAYRQ